MSSKRHSSLETAAAGTHRGGRFVLRAVLLGLGLTLALVLLLVTSRDSQAKPGADKLVVSMESPGQLFMDRNNFCVKGGALGPDSGWYHLRVSNPLNQTYTGLQLTIQAPSGLTIGDNVRYLGSLTPSQPAADIFFFVDYSALRSDPDCKTGNPPVSYSQPFTVTITSIDNGMLGSRQFTADLTSVGMTSAASGGSFISYNLNAGAYVGQIITTTVTYRYGNNSNGTPLLVEPTGNALFDENCYRLANAKVKQSNVAGVAVGAERTIWFPAATTESGDEIKMEFAFEARCASSNTLSYPWSNILSGSDMNYNLATFGSSGGGSSGGVPLPPPAPVEMAVSVTAGAGPEVVIGGAPVTFQVRFKNNAAAAILIDNIDGNLPDGSAFNVMTSNSHVTVANSSIYPLPGAGHKVKWYGIPLFSYVIPGASSTVFAAAGLPAMGALAEAPAAPAANPGELLLEFTVQAPAEDGAYSTTITPTIGGTTLPPVKADFEVNNNPTAATLGDFTVSARPEGGVRVAWTTLMEFNTLGFNVYRRNLAGGAFERLNSDLILAQDLGGVMGGAYELVDLAAQPGASYEYQLEEIEASGSVRLQGRQQVTLPVVVQGSVIFFPLVRK